MDTDCRVKRADFIDRSVKTREFFNFAHPEEIVTANQKYNDSFYGSQLWDLRNQSAEMIFASWRTNIKLVWNLPRNTKSYFIEHLLAPQMISPRVSLLSRFHNFFHGLLQSDSEEVRIISRIAARDIRSNLGKNLDYLRRETGLDPWLFGNQRMKEELLNHSFPTVPSSDEWRIVYARKLLYKRQEAYYTGNDEVWNDTNTLLQSLVTS